MFASNDVRVAVVVGEAVGTVDEAGEEEAVADVGGAEGGCGGTAGGESVEAGGDGVPSEGEGTDGGGVPEGTSEMTSRFTVPGATSEGVFCFVARLP